jgi:glycosyltransferase involved in cell wall biosynthesis
MRILQSITYYMPYVSGITVYAKRLGEALIKKGADVKVITSQYNDGLKLKEKQKKIEVLRVPVLFSVNKGPVMPGWPVKVWKELKQVDAVLVHLPQFEGFITSILAKFRGRLLIAVYHCEVTLPKGFFNSLVERALDFSQLTTCTLADRIVVYTDDYAKHSRIASRFLDKTAQIYPPIRVESGKLKVKNYRKEKPRRGIKIGFAGRIAAEKGLEILIAAIEQLDVQDGDVKLIIAGPEPVGEDAYVKKIKNLVKKINRDVVFLGNLEQKELVKFYKNIDVLVLPSINSTEAFGLVQVEAMLCGTPVIAVDLPGVRVPIQKTGMGEIVKPKDSKTLAKAILKILQNRKKYIKSRSEIKKIFNLEETINKYQQIIQG